MNLLEQAEADNSFLLEDTVSGFGRSGTFTDAQGVDYVVGVQFIRRGVKIDPATGMQVLGDEAYVTARLSRFDVANLPGAGWSFSCADSTGVTTRYKLEVKPAIDRVLGRLTVGLKRIEA